MRWTAIVAGVGAFLGLHGRAHAVQAEYFEVRVVDGAGNGVPCVELSTTHAVSLRTDIDGRAAFYEPGLMTTPVWLHVAGPHVQLAADAFGYSGAAVTPVEGGSVEIEVELVGAPPCTTDDREGRRIARGVPSPNELFRIDVRDDETDRGVPLVFVESADDRWVSDSGGHIAIDPLDLDAAPFDVTVWSHGYAFADDGALAVAVVAGETLELTATRSLAAERLYRVTGGGIYRDTVLLGLEAPLAQPAIAGLVVGQDSVFTALHRGELRWIWGDTTRPAYPLGNFHASGATSVLPTQGGLDAELGVDLSYFVDGSGFSRAMAPTETVPGEGVTWLGGLVSVPGDDGEPHLHATFAMVRADFSKTRFGMLAYDDANERFVEGVDFELSGSEQRYPHENAFIVAHDAAEWVYYHAPVRIPARSEALLDPSTYETFTPYLDAAATQIDRADDGRARYQWRGGGIPYAAADPALEPIDALDVHIVDVRTGTAFEAHGNGSTEWNDFTGRWLRLITPRWALGETWLALSDTPMGPWVYATQLVTHTDYTFYNPRHHRVFDGEHGRRIHFEATYTNSFSGNDDRTPRYDYNQVMYGVDVDRPELALPLPVYTSARDELGPASVLAPGDAPIVAEFFAPQRPAEGTVPMWWSGPSCEPRRLQIGGPAGTTPLFYVLPNTSAQGDLQVVLREGGGDTPSYGVDDDDGEPIAVVWRNPLGITLPVADYLPPLRADAGADQCVGDGEQLELPTRDDVPEGGSAHWELDGFPLEDGADATPGLHMLARVRTRADGLRVRDEAIVRIGPPDGGGTLDDAGSADGTDGSAATGDDAGSDGDSAGAREGQGDGCGCTSGSTRAPLGLGLAGLLLLGFRRRRAFARLQRCSRATRVLPKTEKENPRMSIRDYRSFAGAAALSVLLSCGAPPAEQAQPAASATSHVTTKPAVTPAAVDPVWHYGGADGPLNWGKLSPKFVTCGDGRSQSPVDIADPVVGTEALEVKIDLTPGTLRIAHHEHVSDGINNGHTIQINYEGADELTIANDTYALVQYHFHNQSEHTVKGQHYPMEMHFVHKAPNGKLAVVAVFIEEGAHNAAFDPIWSNLPKQKGTETHYAQVTVDVDKLLPTSRASYRYDGSLTTPPCSEGVRWIIMTTPIQLSPDQIKAFTAIIHDNNRPTQPLDGRPVLTETVSVPSL